MNFVQRKLEVFSVPLFWMQGKCGDFFRASVAMYFEISI
jgi:hypothetical protein